MGKVITFGEMLMRLSVPNTFRFSQADAFDACFGGAEFNVAVALANFGVNTEFITRLPDNDLGKRAITEMRKNNVTCNNVIIGGDRLGLYFLEEGSGIRGSKVIYDRAGSAMVTIEKGRIDWEKIFSGATVFHWSGITPAISQNAADVCLEALQFARKAGLTISCDLNYRAKLWQYGKEPKEVMPELLQYCDILLGDIDTALFMLGKEKKSPDYRDLESLPNQYDALFALLPDLKQMGTTIRYSLNHSHQQIGGILYNGKQLFDTPIHDITPVVDRIGTGDAFMGGLLYGLLNERFNEQQALGFAVASCCLKHTIKGDLNRVTIDEVWNFINGDTSGRVIR